ncbi:MAG: endonuclease/exonuclease/phosphatase family protein [Puniceicoccaceae bacterium]
MRAVTSLGIVFVVALWSPLGGGAAEPPTAIRVLSWNLRNYNLSDRYLYEQYRRQYPKPESEKAALRAVITSLAPDVLLLQEVGNDRFLRELSEDLRREAGLQYSAFETLLAVDTERRLGVMSRIPWVQVGSALPPGANFPYLGDRVGVKRGLLQVQPALPGAPALTLLTLHLKSRFTSDERDPGSAERREKEARLIRDALRDQFAADPDRAWVLVGDLNDHAASPAYDRLTVVNGQPVMLEIPVIDRSGLSWTYHYARQRRYEQIDFLFVSPSLYDSPHWQIEALIVDHPQVLQASDHRPILIDLRWIP